WQSPEAPMPANADVPCSGVSPCAAPVLVAIPQPPVANNPHVDPSLTVAGGCVSTNPLSLAPQQPATSFNPLPAAERQFRFYNVQSSPAPTFAYSLGWTSPDWSNISLNGGTQAQQITITFTASDSTVVLAWGGHIGARADWGCADTQLSAG